MHTPTWLASAAPSPQPSANGPAAEPLCVENIGPRGRSQRARYGVGMLVFGLILAGVLIASGAGRAWRLALFLPFAAAGTGFFQSYEKT